jgi:hypothetical protein
MISVFRTFNRSFSAFLRVSSGGRDAHGSIDVALRRVAGDRAGAAKRAVVEISRADHSATGYLVCEVSMTPAASRRGCSTPGSSYRRTKSGMDCVRVARFRRYLAVFRALAAGQQDDFGVSPVQQEIFGVFEGLILRTGCSREK